MCRYVGTDYTAPGAVPLTYVERPTSDVDCNKHTIDPTITSASVLTGVVTTGDVILDDVTIQRLVIECAHL